MPMPTVPDFTATSLDALTQWIESDTLPPVERWNPAHEGRIDIRIDAEGRWFHEGGEITRPAMVRAFSSLLMRDAGGQHWLATPHEKLSIEVEDAAFIAVDVKQENGALAFRLGTDDLVLAGPDNPILARGDPDCPALYLSVRHGTEARLNRSTYGQLIEIAHATGDLSVTSQGKTFSLVPA